MFTFADVKGKEHEKLFIPGYEFSYFLPVELMRDYENNNMQTIDMVNAAMMLGYYMGKEAQKHAADAGEKPAV